MVWVVLFTCCPVLMDEKQPAPMILGVGCDLEEVIPVTWRAMQDQIGRTKDAERGKSSVYFLPAAFKVSTISSMWQRLHNFTVQWPGSKCPFCIKLFVEWLEECAIGPFCISCPLNQWVVMELPTVPASLVYPSSVALYLFLVNPFSVQSQQAIYTYTFARNVCIWKWVGRHHSKLQQDLFPMYTVAYLGKFKTKKHQHDAENTQD